MWLKTIIVIFLFYLFAVLQNSFFTHFNLFGIFPNFVFILFFLLIFFEKKNDYYKIIAWSVIAGLILDIFSYTYFGASVILFLFISFLAKRAQSLLKERNEAKPLFYFLPLFLVCFLVYEILLALHLRFIDPSHTAIFFDWRVILEMVYNLIFAAIFFLVYKKFFYSNV